MKRDVTVAMVFGLCVAMMAAFCMTGCDEGDGSGLTVSPSDVSLQRGSNFVTFSVSSNSGHTFSNPIEWSVSDPTLGTIIRSSDQMALYERTDNNGNNIVTARDPYGAEGFATVRQIENQYVLTLTADPATMLSGTNMSTITATGGVAPLSWWVRDEDVGEVISGRGSFTAVYEAFQRRENVVHARDANGVLGTVTINALP